MNKNTLIFVLVAIAIITGLAIFLLGEYPEGVSEVPPPTDQGGQTTGSSPLNTSIDLTNNEVACEQKPKIGMGDIPGGDFRYINELGSAGEAVFSAKVISRKFSLFDNTFEGIFLVIPPFEEDSPQSRFYTYFSEIVEQGNTINYKEGEDLFFKLGILEDDDISSTANFSDLARAKVLAALSSGGTTSLKIEVPLYVGAGAPENFSYACAVSVPE